VDDAFGSFVMPGLSSGGRTLSTMATTVRVEIDSELLARLRNRHPGKPDRELIEDLARIELSFGALADMRARNAMSEPEATDLAVRAVHDARSASA
jgi:predicted alpha/beta-hydrolase family hydrolase